MLFLFVFCKPVIKIVGNRRIESDMIKSKISDDALQDDEVLNKTLKDLYETGHFKDIKFKKSTDQLLVEVKENPIINKIAFEGNNKIKDQELLDIIKIKPNQTFAPFKVVEAETIILESYRQSFGRHNITVQSKIVELPDNRVDLVFVVHEGSKGYIRSINFVGNKSVLAKDLKKAIQSKEHHFYNFFSQDDFYNQDRMQSDEASIQQYYRNSGFPDAKVMSSHSEYTKDGAGFQLTFFIEEGAKYNIGKVGINNGIQGANIDKLKKVIATKEGSIYNRGYIDWTMRYMVDLLGEQGFNAVDVSHQETREGNKIHIMYVVKKGTLQKIRRINISGNTRTHERVIRNYMSIKEEDTYNKHKLNESEQAIRNTGFFSKVNIYSVPVEQGVVDIDVKVEETGRTGMASFGIGFSTQDGPFVQVGVVERNIKGTGKTVHAQLEVAKTHQDITFGMEDPRFKGRDLTVGAEVKIQRLSEYEYHGSRSIGVGLNTEYPLGKTLRQGWTYNVGVDKVYAKKGSLSDFSDFDKYETLEDLYTAARTNKALQDKIKSKGETEKGLDVFGPPLIPMPAPAPYLPHRNGFAVSKEEQFWYGFEKRLRDSRVRDAIYKDDLGTKMFSSIGHTLKWYPQPLGNKRYRFSTWMANDIAGLGGSVGYFKNTFGCGYRYGITSSLTLNTEFSYSFMTQFTGKNLRIVDTYKMGGTNFHGFDFMGISPREENTRIAVGGTRKYFGKIGLDFPIGLPEDYGVKAGVYTEFGSAYRSKFGNKDLIKKLSDDFVQGEYNHTSGSPGKILDDSSMRVAIGAKLSIVTPMGPIEFHYAIPVKKQKYDVIQQFMIGMSTGF